MQYPQYFQNILLEQDLPDGGNSRTHSAPNDALKSFFDSDTPEGALDTDGMPDLGGDLDGFMNAIEDFKKKKDAYVKKAQSLLDYYSSALESLDDGKNVSASAVKIRDSVGGYSTLENIVGRLEDIVKQTQEKGSTEDIERIISNAKSAQQGDPMQRGPVQQPDQPLGMRYSENVRRKKSRNQKTIRG